MKKFFVLTFALMFGLSITACGAGQSGAYPKTPKEVAQRFMELYTAATALPPTMSSSTAAICWSWP